MMLICAGIWSALDRISIIFASNLQSTSDSSKKYYLLEHLSNQHHIKRVLKREYALIRIHNYRFINTYVVPKQRIYAVPELEY